MSLLFPLLIPLKGLINSPVSLCVGGADCSGGLPGASGGSSGGPGQKFMQPSCAILRSVAYSYPHITP